MKALHNITSKVVSIVTIIQRPQCQLLMSIIELYGKMLDKQTVVELLQA